MNRSQKSDFRLYTAALAQWMKPAFDKIQLLTVSTLRKGALLLGACLLVLGNALAQNQAEIDSLLEVTKNMPDNLEKAKNLGRLHELTMFTDPDLARAYAMEAFDISKKMQDERGIAIGYLQIGNYFNNRNEDDSASHYYQQALARFKEISSVRGQIFVNHSLADIERSRGNYDRAIAIVNETIALYEERDAETSDLGDFNLIGAEYQVLGAIYMDKGSYRLALQETLKALRFFEEKEDQLREADALQQLGDIEYVLKNYSLSLSYSERAMEIYRAFDDKVFQTYAATNAGLAAAEMGKDSLAMSYQRLAIGLSREMEVKSSLSEALKELGRLHIRRREYGLAREALQEALWIARQTEIKLDIASALLTLATLDRETNAPRQALEKLNEVIDLLEPIGALDYLSSAYESRAAVLESLGDRAAALRDYRKFHELNERIYNTTKSQQIEELKTIYETEKKEAALALQQKEIESLNQELKIGRLQRGLFAGGMFTFIAMSGLLWFGFRQKIRKDRVEREAQEEIYRRELSFKKKELTSQTLHLVQKNLFLENLRENLEGARKSPETFRVESGRVLTSLKTEAALDQDWETFKSYFVEVHNDFDQKLLGVYPEITENEMRLAYFVRMNLNTREIAAMLHVLPESVRKSRYRLKKKLDLGKDDDLYEFLVDL